MSVKKLALYSVFLAVSTLLGYVESLIPLPFLPPGVHLGLANACFLLLLLHFVWYEVLVVDIARVLLVALLRGSFMSMGFFMSLAGALLSFIAMALSTGLLKKRLSPFGHSLLGSTFHAVGQIAAGCLYMMTSALLYYLPILILVNELSALLVGLLVTLLENNSYLRSYFERFSKRAKIEASENPSE